MGPSDGGRAGSMGAGGLPAGATVAARVGWAVGHTGLGVGASRFAAGVGLDLLYDRESPVAGTDYGFVLGWATTGHTSAPVPITAIGPGTEQLTGVIENTDLFHAMAHSLSLTESRASQRRA